MANLNNLKPRAVGVCIDRDIICWTQRSTHSYMLVATTCISANYLLSIDMACNSAFAIPEIVSLVIDQLAGDKKSLGRSAQCCTLWLEPSLNLLWRDLGSSADPLRSFLPFRFSETWVSLCFSKINYFCIKSRRSTKELPADAVLHDHDIHRFLFYSRRIYSLQKSLDVLTLMQSQQTWKFSFILQIAHLWQAHFPPPFPALRKLEVELAFLPSPKAFLWSSIAPNLQDVSIVDFGDGHEGFLKALQEGGPLTPAPTIKSLAIASMVMLTHVTLIEHLPAIETLDLRRASTFRVSSRILQKLFCELSTRPNLRTLILPNNLRSHHIPQLNNSGYSSLTTLVAYTDLSLLGGVLNMLPDGRLSLLCLKEDHTFIDNSDTVFFDLLAQQISRKFHSSLREISVDANRTALLPRILEMKLIEAVELPTSFATWPFIETMASSWPLMKSLKLSGPPSNNQYEFCSLKNLSLLASLFPHLQTLSFPLRDDFMPDITEILPSNHSLEFLYLRSSTFLDRNELARILNKIFPKLQIADVKGPRKMFRG